MDALFLAFLAQHDDGAWHRVVDRLGQACHPVDRTAVRIWFHLFPLALQQAMDEAEDPSKLAIRLRLDGRWRLADQIDTSHRFLYGHRHWPGVKAAVMAYATRSVAPSSLDLAAQIQEIARGLSSETGTRVDELVAITAIGVRTLQQVGLHAFSASMVSGPNGGHRFSRASTVPAASPKTVLAARARDDSQGLFGRFRGDRRRWTIAFDEGDPDARFPLVHSQHLTTAAALDRRDHRARDSRCSEGPIPVQCRSCSCGTCWVGVLGGAEKLSPMDDRERGKLASCGYIEASEERPIIRLACMAQAFGAISIVIPPWNGQLPSALKKASISSSTGPR